MLIGSRLPQGPMLVEAFCGQWPSSSANAFFCQLLCGRGEVNERVVVQPGGDRHSGSRTVVFCPRGDPAPGARGDVIGGRTLAHCRSFRQASTTLEERVAALGADFGRDGNREPWRPGVHAVGEARHSAPSDSPNPSWETLGGLTWRTTSYGNGDAPRGNWLP